MNPITPTVGRVVLVRSDDHTATGASRDREVPGLITAVHSDTCINVMVMRDGWQETPKCVTSISYHEGETTTSPGTTWRWMPYQLATELAKASPPPTAAIPVTQEELADPTPSVERVRGYCLDLAVRFCRGDDEPSAAVKAAASFEAFMTGAPPSRKPHDEVGVAQVELAAVADGPNPGLLLQSGVTASYVAMVAHEVNRAWCERLGDTSQPGWLDAPKWQRDSAINGVLFHVANPDAGDSASHDAWRAEKVAEGWIYGPVKDPDDKEHPCIVPFDQLPPDQQFKDRLFRTIVHAMV